MGGKESKMQTKKKKKKKRRRKWKMMKKYGQEKRENIVRGWRRSRKKIKLKAKLNGRTLTLTPSNAAESAAAADAVSCAPVVFVYCTFLPANKIIVQKRLPTCHK